MGHRAITATASLGYYRSFDASAQFEGSNWPSIYRSPITPISSLSPSSGTFPLSSAATDYRDQSDGFCATSQNFHAPHPVRVPSHDSNLVAANQLQSTGKIGPTRLITTRGCLELEVDTNSQTPNSVSPASPPHNHQLPEYMAPQQREGHTGRSRSSTPSHVDTPLRETAGESRAIASPSASSSHNHPSTPDPPYQSMIYHADIVPLQIPEVPPPPVDQPVRQWSFSTDSLTAWRPRRQRQKHRKQRLFNVDRKSICEYHKANPTARQEDIAVRYGVERSTISKILKEKDRWLSIPDDGFEKIQVSKQRQAFFFSSPFSHRSRPSKFPRIEDAMLRWMRENVSDTLVLTDNVLRSKAREIAQHQDLDPEVFKASAGWVENFKQRHGIRGGVWHGDGKVKFSRWGVFHKSAPPRPSYARRAGWPDPDAEAKRAAIADDMRTNIIYGFDDLDDSIDVDPPPAQPDDPVSPIAGPSSARPSGSRGSSPHTPQWNPEAGEKRVPTALEARKYLDMVAMFFQESGKDILNDEQRTTLDQIRLQLEEADQATHDH